jgi:hypothetical protein
LEQLGQVIQQRSREELRIDVPGGPFLGQLDHLNGFRGVERSLLLAAVSCGAGSIVEQSREGIECVRETAAGPAAALGERDPVARGVVAAARGIEKSLSLRCDIPQELSGYESSRSS